MANLPAASPSAWNNAGFYAGNYPNRELKWETNSCLGILTSHRLFNHIIIEFILMLITKRTIFFNYKLSSYRIKLVYIDSCTVDNHPLTIKDKGGKRFLKMNTTQNQTVFHLDLLFYLLTSTTTNINQALLQNHISGMDTIVQTLTNLHHSGEPVRKRFYGYKN